MQPKKIFFFGTPDIAVPTLQTLASLENIEVVGVGVFPDKKVGRHHTLTPCPVKKTAQTLNLPIFEIQEKKDLIHIFKNQTFDLAIVIAFGMIFPESILTIPPFGVINIHFSLLPKLRGASPIQSAILEGKKKSGITLQRMVKALDAGDILYQQPYNIQHQKTSEIFANFAQITAEIMPKFLESYFSGKIKPIPQNESHATFCSKFEKKDGEVFPEKETAEEIYRKYLAFDVFPKIFLKTKAGNTKLTQISLTKHPDSLELQCNQNTKLFILAAQLPSKKAMPISEILKGHPNLFITTKK